MKRLLILSILIISSFLSHSQGFGGGLFAGISTSQIHGDEFGGFNKVGFYGGGFTDFRFTPKSTLQLEFAFLQRGSKQTLTDKQEGILYGQNYIEIIPLYRWYGIKNMSLEIGPSFSYLINSTQEGTLNRLWIEATNPAPFNKFDISIAGGLSYYFFKGKLEVNARYSTSVIPTSTAYSKVWFHHVILFSIRYWFKTSIAQATASFKKDKVKINLDLGGNDQESKDE
jgi:hypothetical protein